VVIHEWLGIGLGLALLSYLTLHWDWVVRMNRRLFSPRGRDKLIWLVNLALLFAMTLRVASGIAISRVALPELGIGSGRPGLFPGDLLEPVNLVVLRNSAFLEAVVITAVVIVDASYRILRRAGRART